MAAERARRLDDASPDDASPDDASPDDASPDDAMVITPDGPTRIDHAPASSGRAYRLGPDDLEEFINLGEEGQRRLAETPGALDQWLAAHAAKDEYQPGLSDGRIHDRVYAELDEAFFG